MWRLPFPSPSAYDKKENGKVPLSHPGADTGHGRDDRPAPRPGAAMCRRRPRIHLVRADRRRAGRLATPRHGVRLRCRSPRGKHVTKTNRPGPHSREHGQATLDPRRTEASRLSIAAPSCDACATVLQPHSRSRPDRRSRGVLGLLGGVSEVTGVRVMASRRRTPSSTQDERAA